MSVREFTPSECGFLRRKEMEDPEAPIQVWETPDGRIVVHDRRHGPLRVLVYQGFGSIQ